MSNTPIDRLPQAVLQVFQAAAYSIGLEVDTTDGAQRYYVRLTDKRAYADWIAKWTTRQFPNCRGLCITTDTEVSAVLRGNGLGKKMRDLRLQAYKLAGFRVDLSTVRHDNKIQRHLMYAGGGVQVDIPHTNQDGNTIRFFAVDIVEAVDNA